MSKRNRMLPVEIEIENNPILKEALSQSALLEIIATATCSDMFSDQMSHVYLGQ